MTDDIDEILIDITRLLAKVRELPDGCPLRVYLESTLDLAPEDPLGDAATR